MKTKKTNQQRVGKKKLQPSVGESKDNHTFESGIENSKIMKLKFIPPPKPTPVYTANVHSTGKIGFTVATAKHFGITTSKSIQLAVNEEDPIDESIYGVILDTVDEDMAYRIMKGGDYHSLNAKAFLDSIGLKYNEGQISYVITEIDVDGAKVLKFTKKENKTIYVAK